MRTVRRQVAVLNAGKAIALRALVSAFADEKRLWLDRFARKDHRHLIAKHRQVRDAALKAGYAPKSGLQARMWKLALVDAAQTWDKYWQALFVEVRSAVAKRKDFDENDQHYAFWLLAGYTQFFAAVDGKASEPKFAIEPARREAVMFFVRRQVRRLRGRNPMVRTARSAVFDAQCYNVFEEGSTQYLKIMGLERGKRIALPLLGKTAISGNIRVVLAEDGPVEVHCGFDLNPAEPPASGGETVALDTGYTEAFVDTAGKAYGDGLGVAITKASNERHDTGKARNKLRAIAEKAARSDPAKARRIRKNNLGKVKWQRRERKARATINRIINTGLNEVLASRQVASVATEDLRHSFTLDKPPAWNRRLAAWVRGTLQDRVIFKSSAEGFRHTQVNAAYSSQECPLCGFVDRGNRTGDRFVCLHCGHEDHADRVGATNIASRLTDPEITRFTPFREVKAILLTRFHRRLEATGKRTAPQGAAPAPRATVPGRTPDTAPLARPRPAQDIGFVGEAPKPLAPDGHSESETT